jgi:hypothetical protein
MQATAEFLLSRPEFNTPSDSHSLYLGRYWEEEGKNMLITMVKAVGAIKKEYSGSDLHIHLQTPLAIWTCIDRDKVCRKVQEEKWECELLLTAEDDAILTEADIPF